MPKITVIIPNFNHGHLITDCLLGLQAQTYTDFETIVIDDKSTDNSIEIIQAVIRDDKRFKLLQLPSNVGVVNVLNMGIGMSASDYIYLGAADDITVPTLFENLMRPLEKSKTAAFAVCEVELINQVDFPAKSSIRPGVRPANKEYEFSPKESLKILKSTDNWALTGASVIRRDFLVISGQLKAELGSGSDGFILRKLALTYGFVFVPKIGLICRRTSSGYSAATLVDRDIFRFQLTEYCKALTLDPIFPIWYPEKYSKRMHFSQRLFQINSPGQNSNLKVYWLNLAAYIKYWPYPIHKLIATLFGRKIHRFLK